jgi:hypothetical protein
MGSYIHDARVAVRTDKDRETQVKLDRLQDRSSGHAVDVACGSTTTLLAEKLPELELLKGFGAILKCQQAKQDAQQAEEVGQIVLNRKATQQKLDGQLATARELGGKLEQLGTLLQRSPETIKLEGVGFDPRYAPLAAPSFKPHVIDGKAISDLPTAIRSAMDELRRINEQARSFGV